MKSGAKFVDKTSQPNDHHRLAEHKRSRVKLTSIGEIFQFEINIMKLFGGFMLDERFNWYLSVAYKLFAALLGAYFIQGTHIVYDRMTIDTKSARQYIKFFWTLHFVAGIFAFLNTCFSSIRNKRLMTVLLSKRLDGRYFEHSLARLSGTPRRAPSSLADDYEHASSVITPHGWSENDKGPIEMHAHHTKRACEGQDWPPVGAEFRREVRANLRSLRRDFGEGVRNIFDQFSKVRLARLLVIVSVLLSATTATLRVDYKLHYGTSLLAPKSATAPGLAEVAAGAGEAGALLTALSPDEARATSEDRFAIESATGQMLRESIGQMTEWTRRLSRRLMELARMAPTFLWKLLLVVSIFSLMYGQSALTLFITAALSDALRQARRAQWARIEARLRARADERWCDREEEALAVEQALSSEMTELLIQAREVLLALRSVMSLNYLFLQVLDMSLQMAYFSMFISFLASNQLDWLTLLTVDYAAMIMIAVCGRIGYIWLHAEVSKISSIYERRIIASALETNDLIEHLPVREASMTSDSSLGSPPASLVAGAALATDRPGSPSNWPLTWRPRALQTDEIKLQQKKTAATNSRSSRRAPYLARIEATTNFRLAQEIAQLWPTDWFHPDLQSYVSQNFFVITFVATLQQLVEAGAKLQLQTRRNGFSVAANKSAPATAIH